MSTMYVNNIAPLEGNTINVASGNTLYAPGSVIQIVQGSTTTQEETSSTSYVDTNLSVSITPKSSSSILLATMVLGGSGAYNSSGPDSRAEYEIYDATNEVSLGVTSFRFYDYGNSGGVNWVSNCINKLYSPATTAQITFKVRYKMLSAAGIRISENGCLSTLTIQEIAQ